VQRRSNELSEFSTLSVFFRRARRLIWSQDQAGSTTALRASTDSQRCRKRIEEIFGWIKQQAGFAGVNVRGKLRVNDAFTLAVAAYNLIRIPKLLASATM
jgi:hypothetical protein